MNVVVTILAFGLLIAIHEYGHYFMAKRAGMRVEMFSIGFGPRLFGWKRGEVEWRVGLLPLGGFVKIAGMNPGEEGVESDPRAYQNRPLLQRFLVIAAGPTMNYVLAFFLVTALAMIGAQQPNLESTQIGAVLPDHPAAQAGLQAGDRIVSIEGTPVADWKALSEQIKPRAGQETRITVERGGETIERTIVPAENPQVGGGAIGIQASEKLERLGPIDAVTSGAAWVWNVNARMVGGLWEMITGKTEAELQGPVGIIHTTVQQSREGIDAFVMTLALISVAIALFNFLPIPALDGGRLAFLVIEALSRRKVNQRVEAAVHAVGMMLLLALIAFVTFGDIRRIGG